MTLEGKVNLDGICAAVYLDVWCYTEVNSQSTFISKFTNTNKSYTKLSTWWKIQIYTGRVFIWTCSVCIQKWLFHCRRSKKLIHQKKWRFGNSRKRTEAIWGSGFQFLYSFLEKVCSGKSQTKLFLRSSFTQLWCTTIYQAKPVSLGFSGFGNGELDWPEPFGSTFYLLRTLCESLADHAELSQMKSSTTAVRELLSW